MKSQVDMNHLNEESQYRQKGKVGIGFTKEGESSSKELKRIKDLLVVTVIKQGINQTNVGAMGKKNSMESATIAIIMVIGLMIANRNLSLKANVTNVRSMGTNPQNAKLR